MTSNIYLSHVTSNIIESPIKGPMFPRKSFTLDRKRGFTFVGLQETSYYLIILHFSGNYVSAYNTIFMVQKTLKS